jgi:hypothetical protein
VVTVPCGTLTWLFALILLGLDCRSHPGRLELTGMLKRTRRHKRAWVTVSGLLRQTTVQQSNLYAFSRPNAAAHLVPRPRKVLSAGERVGRLLRNLGRETDPSLKIEFKR